MAPAPLTPVSRDDVLEVLRLLRAARLSNAPREVVADTTTPAEVQARAAALDETARTVDLWWLSFQDWTRQQLQAAAVAYLNSPDPGHRFWPTPGALRAALPRPPEQVQLTPEEVWPFALQALMSAGGGEEQGFFGPAGEWTSRHRVGRWKYAMAKRFGIEIMERALAAMGGVAGYDEIARGLVDDHVAHRARFCNAWAGALERDQENRLWDQLSSALAAGTGARAFGAPARRQPPPPPPLRVLPAPSDPAPGTVEAALAEEHGARRPEPVRVLRPDQGWNQPAVEHFEGEPAAALGASSRGPR